MSVGTVYDYAYRGDFNQVKVQLDEDKELITSPDLVSSLKLYIEYNMEFNITFFFRTIGFSFIGRLWVDTKT